MVAKSYLENEQIGDPFYSDGKRYVTIRLKNGGVKTVRDYDVDEWNKMYGGKGGDLKRIKSLKDTLGFEAGYVTIFKGDTYNNKDFLHSIGCTYHRMWGWSLAGDKTLPELPDDIVPIRLEWDAISKNEDSLKSEKEVTDYIDSLVYEGTSSTYQGNVGDRLDLQIIVTGNVEFEGRYGKAICHTFEDIYGNHYSWFTSSKNLPIGERYHIRGTVKDHQIYHNDKQTVLTRCAIIS